ncbi:Hypothetical predicted protein, partial [Pelobates cultripes]
YLDKVGLPKLELAQEQALLQPITLQEVKDSIKQLPSSKSPGVDGLPKECYKRFGDILAPQLLQVFHRANELGSLPPELLLATVITIPKLEKTPDICKHFCPFSLLNMDAKLYAMILATADP